MYVLEKKKISSLQEGKWLLEAGKGGNELSVCIVF